MINWTQMYQLKAGDWALFDPQFGPEKVMADPVTLPVGAGSGFFSVVSLTVCDERKPGPTQRNILRGVSEGVIVVWSCAGCGALTGRYDSGEACEACVTSSFAEAG